MARLYITFKFLGKSYLNFRKEYVSFVVLLSMIYFYNKKEKFNLIFDIKTKNLIYLLYKN